MKFDHQLKFNAAPEWKDFYINYARLKVQRERGG
jgi:SPX domain protein involved in polyphosphate accumulation